MTTKEMWFNERGNKIISNRKKKTGKNQDKMKIFCEYIWNEKPLQVYADDDDI